MVKFFRASDEETYSLQIDDHFEVLTKKTQIFPGINITDLEGKIVGQGRCFYWSDFVQSAKITIQN